MDASANDDRVAVCSVSEMAHQLGLSRGRFYQLVKRGVFPPPARSDMRRPLYTPDLQEQCRQVRRTGVGFNGSPVLFNRRRRSGKARSGPDSQYDGLAAALKNMGLKVNTSAVKHAVQALYPAGQERSQDPSEVLRSLFQHFHKTVKKVSN